MASGLQARATVTESRPDHEPSAGSPPHTGPMKSRQNEDRFSLLVADEGDEAVVRVTGELDSLSACELRAGVADVLGSRRTILDIRDVPFVDSAGLGALMGGIRRLREAGGSVALCCTRSSVLRLLRMTGLDRVVAITPSPADARRAMEDASASQDPVVV